MRISKKDYLKALKLVELYHEQIKDDCKDFEKILTQIEVTRLDNEKILQRCSTRLRNVLYYSAEYMMNEKSIGFENIAKRDFIRMRNAGEKSWLEFIEIRGY